MRYFILFALLMGCGKSETKVSQDLENKAPKNMEGDEPGECTDRADNDQDGQFDCDDSDCSGSPDCKSASISAPSKKKNKAKTDGASNKSMAIASTSEQKGLNRDERREAKEFSPWDSDEFTVNGKIDLPKIGQHYASKLGCTGCHSSDGSALTGTTFLGVYGQTRHFNDGTAAVVDEAYLLESILEPQKKIVQGYRKGSMNSGWEVKFKGSNARNLDVIIEYIKSLK